MRLTPEEKYCLEELYIHFAVPTDQLKRKRSVLVYIVNAFNRLTGRDDDVDEVLRHMFNRRKSKDWPRLGDRARRFVPAQHELLDGELEVLMAAYVAIDVPLDEYLLRQDLPRKLAKGFTMATQRIVSSSTLVAALMAHRKRGLLPCLFDEKVAKTPQPFADIHVVDREHRRSASN
jgi:hypothetical protein